MGISLLGASTGLSASDLVTNSNWTYITGSSPAGSATTVTFSSATFATYRKLKIFIHCQTSNSRSEYLAINGDTSNYSAAGHAVFTSSSSYHYGGSFGLDSLYLNNKDFTSLYSVGGGQYMFSVIEISNANDTNPKQFKVFSNYKDGSSYNWNLTKEGIYRPATGATITSLTYGATAGNLNSAGYEGIRIFGAN